MSDEPLSIGTISWELLDRYHTGEASPEEQRRVLGYLAGHPARGAVLASLARAVRRSQEAVSLEHARKLLRAAHARLARGASFREVLQDRTPDRLGAAVAALLDVQTDALSAEDIKELQRMIDAAREDGR